MPTRNAATVHSLKELVAEKAYATKISTSAASQAIDLTAIQMPLSPSGDKVCDPSGINEPLLMLQCDADFYYSFGTAAVTLPAGANPGVFVPAGQQEQVRPASGPGRNTLNVIQSTATGTLRVYVSRTAVRS